MNTENILNIGCGRSFLTSLRRVPSIVSNRRQETCERPEADLVGSLVRACVTTALCGDAFMRHGFTSEQVKERKLEESLPTQNCGLWWLALPKGSNMATASNKSGEGRRGGQIVNRLLFLYDHGSKGYLFSSHPRWHRLTFMTRPVFSSQALSVEDDRLRSSAGERFLCHFSLG